jgi:hypothetical protein
MILIAAIVAIVMTASSIPASAVTVAAPVSTAQHHIKLGPLLTWAQVERQVAEHPDQNEDFAICLWNSDNSCVTIRNTMKASEASGKANIDWQSLVESIISWGISIWIYRQVKKGGSSQDDNGGNTNGDDDYEGDYLAAQGSGDVAAGNYSGGGTYWDYQPNPQGGDYIWNTKQHQYLTTASPNLFSLDDLSGKIGWFTWGFRADE